MKPLKFARPARVPKRPAPAKSRPQKAQGQNVEVLEGRIAPASIATLTGGGSITVVGDQGVPGEIETLVFSLSGGLLHITDATHAITAGSGFTQNGGNDVSILLTSLTADLTVDTGTGADLISINSAFSLPG